MGRRTARTEKREARRATSDEIQVREKEGRKTEIGKRRRNAGRALCMACALLTTQCPLCNASPDQVRLQYLHLHRSSSLSPSLSLSLSLSPPTINSRLYSCSFRLLMNTAYALAMLQCRSPLATLSPALFRASRAVDQPILQCSQLSCLRCHRCVLRFIYSRRMAYKSVPVLAPE
jgi:hypothetical protein